MVRWLFAAWMVVGCAPALEGEGLVGDGALNPFPTVLHMVDGRVALPDTLPRAIDGTPLPVDRVAWRTGFSPVQVSYARLPDVDASALPGWRDAQAGEGGVLLADLTAGVFLPVMAELDAAEDAADAPSLLIRPLAAIPDGHRAAVVVTTDAAPRPARFDALLRGRAPEDLRDVRDHFRDLVDALGALGVNPDRIALAWDYPVENGTRPTKTAVAGRGAPGAALLSRVRALDDGDRVAPHTWRAADGNFETPWVLDEDEWLAMDATGAVTRQGARRVPLYVHIPESVKDAPAGTVPVMVYGHGIFGKPELYLDDMNDDDGVLALAEEAGVIVVATRWYGMSADERIDALGVAQDFGKLPIVTDRLVQGIVQTRALIDLVVDGDLLDDPVLAGASGQKLGDPSRVVYYGISLGGIEGAVLVGGGAPVDAAVFHVGGGAWSTMLERSSQWVAFDLFIDIAVPDPADRQLLYAVSQLWWDMVDPGAWTAELAAGPPVLWQEAMGDEQVPNLTTELVARSAGAVLLAPYHRLPVGMETDAAPSEASRVLAQFDPRVGEPEDVNRPPGNLRAHSIPRRWPGAWRQAAAFLTGSGLAESLCGELACSADHTGGE